MARNFRRLVRDEAGLTLIEVMATALIVALLATATATALIATARASGHEQFRSEADSLSAQDQDQLRGLSDEQLLAIQNGPQNGGVARTHTVQLGGITFTVASTVKFGSATNVTGCTAGSASYYDTTSTVTWTESGKTQTVAENSLLTRPVYGSLVVLVQDTSKNPLAGATVTATNQSTTTNAGEQQTATTNSSGCVQFAGLDAGNYTVSVVEPGYVDVNGNGSSSSSPTTQTVNLASSGGSVSFTLSRSAGPITATFQTTKTGVGAQADGISWNATGMTTNGTATANDGTAASSQMTSSTLYPGTYSLWAGQCGSQEPSTSSGYIGSATVVAGGTASTTIKEPLLNLSTVNYAVTTTTTTGSGSNRQTTTTTTTTKVQPADIVFTYIDTSTSPRCVDSWTATVAAPASVITGTPPTSTAPATGWLTNQGQPYASTYPLTVCADFKLSGSSTYYYGTTTTTNTNYTTATTVGSITINQGTNPGQCPITTS